MHSFSMRRFAPWYAAGLVVLAGCSDRNPAGSGWSATDFSLEDVNPNSPSYRQLVGPSNYEGNVSAYYFGDQG